MLLEDIEEDLESDEWRQDLESLKNRLDHDQLNYLREHGNQIGGYITRKTMEKIDDRSVLSNLKIRAKEFNNEEFFESEDITDRKAGTYFTEFCNELEYMDKKERTPTTYKVDVNRLPSLVNILYALGGEEKPEVKRIRKIVKEEGDLWGEELVERYNKTYSDIRLHEEDLERFADEADIGTSTSLRGKKLFYDY